MTNRTRRRCAALAAVLLWAMPADARPPKPHRGGPPPMDRMLERHAERLGLDEPTRAAIERLSEDSRLARREHHDTLRRLHEEMRALLEGESPDEDAVMQQAERIGAAQTALEKARLRSMLRIRALLTPEQRAELVRIHAERGERGPGRHRRGPPPGGGPPRP